MEEIALQIHNAFQWIVKMEYVLAEKKEIPVLNIRTATQTCTVCKILLIHIYPNAKTFFLPMNPAQILFNASIHFIVGILPQKKAQIMLKIL